MASIKTLLYTSKVLKNGEHPIMICLIKDRKTKYISVGHSCHPNQWDFKKELPKRKHPHFRELEINIDLKRAEAKSLLLSFENEQKDFTLDEFKQKYTVHTKKTSFFEYFRTFRAVYNKAIADGYVKKGDSPFEDFKVSKFKTQTRKRAITKDAIQLLAQVEVKQDSRLFHSRNAFLFSFYCSGMNFVDVAMLTWDNIVNSGEYLHYEREKTGDIFDIKLLQPALDILAFYHNQRIDKYVFPYLNEEEYKTPAQIHDRIEDRRKVTNKDLKKLATAAGVTTPITTYTARHSFATVLKRSGVATGKISELMGHESEKTTQVYLDSFEQKDLHEAMLNLL